MIGNLMPLSESLPTPDVRSLGQPLHDDQWCLFRVSRPNVLLIGPEGDTDLAIASITGWGEEQISVWPAVQPQPLERAPLSTLVVRDVMDLDRSEQARLNEWLTERAEGIRVIATSREPLYGLVERQQFLEPLYYRLNVVCLDAQDVETTDTGARRHSHPR